MTQTKHSMKKLADRMNLEPEAAKYLPSLVSKYSEKLDMTPDELINICGLVPALMTSIAKECRSNVAG